MPDSPKPDNAAPALLSLLLLLGGCAPATLTVRPDPADARILLDGQLRGTGETTVRAPYYGTVEVGAVTQLPSTLDQPGVRGTRALVRVAPPVTPWIFPLDLLGEALARTAGPLQTSAQITVPATPGVAMGEQPADLEDLRTRAAAQRTAR